MKNSPTLQLIVEIWLSYMGIRGLFAKIVSSTLTLILGSMIDKKVILPIDIHQDARKQAMKDPVWRERANALWSKAMSKVYSEEEKDAIRKQYLEALGDYASLADSLRS